MVSTKSHENNQASDKFSSIKWLTNEAVKKHKEGKTEEAIAYYLEVIELNEQQPDWIYANAIILISHIDHLDRALELGNKAIKIHDSSSEILRAISVTYEKKGCIEEYRASCEKVIQIESEQPDWFYSNFIAHLNEHQEVELAIQYGTIANKIYAKNHWIKYHLANSFHIKGMLKEAYEHYVEVLEIKPEFEPALKMFREDDCVSQPKSYKPNKLQSKLEKAINQKGAIDSKRFTITAIDIDREGFLKFTVKDKKTANLVDLSRVILKLDNRKRIGTFEVDRTEQKIDVDVYQFALKLPIFIEKKFLFDNSQHKVDIYFHDKSKNIIGRISKNIQIPFCRVGKVEKLDNGFVEGWALPEKHTDSSVELDIYIDSIFFTRILANRSRKDLLSRGLGNGMNGFKVALPVSTTTKEQHQIDIFFSNTTIALHNSPIALQHATQANTAKYLIFAKITEVAKDGNIQGWIVNNANPNQNLIFTVLVDDQKIGNVKTSGSRSNSSYKFIAGNPHKFAIKLPSIIDKKLLMDGKSHKFTISPLDDAGKVVSTINIPVTLPRIAFGSIEKWDRGKCILRGWALPEGHFGSPAVLEVYLDGIFYVQIKADIQRKDLLGHNLGSGRNGFEFSLPKPPEKKARYQVAIFFKNTNISLRKSPISIEYDREKIEPPQINRFSSLSKFNYQAQIKRQITIVIPVYNAYDEVQECIKSVFRNTSIPARLLIINDGSPDERIAPLLEWADTFPNVEVLTNNPNQGYTRTINRGIRHAENDDIILLNSDTVVGPHWLQNIKIAAYQDIDIGTVTAVSDNSGAFSIPNVGCVNERPAWLERDELVRLFYQNSNLIYPQTPTGSGFCIYIRRELFEHIGLFDEEAFPRGYGEENDFCMRAMHAGWKQVVDERTLVYHVRSASFKEEKETLYRSGRTVVDRRYPEYKEVATGFVHSVEMNNMRYAARKLIKLPPIAFSRRPLPKVLYVIATQTGGTPQTNRDLMGGLKERYSTMLLHCDSRQISVYDTSKGDQILCDRFELNNPITLSKHFSSEYDSIITYILIKYGIELLHIRHFAWHSISLPRVAQQLGIPVILSLHDFYVICPTVNLLDENLKFCGGNCTDTEGDCKTSIWQKAKYAPRLKNNYIHSWRKMMPKVFEYVDAFVTTANSAKEQIIEIYPQLKEAKFKVIPHGRNFHHLLKGSNLSIQPPVAGEPLKILFPGNTGPHKGANLIAQINKLDLENRIEFHFLGRVSKELDSIGIHHGTYARDDFDLHIKKIRPHYIGLFSIWPETYCHTLTESWASGIPVIAIDKGAVGERIRTHGGGWLVDTVEPEEIYNHLLKIASSVDSYVSKVTEVNTWQLSYATQNNVSTMASKYHQLYQQVFAGRLNFSSDPQFEAGKQIRIGIIDNQKNQSITKIPIKSWLNHSHVASELDSQILALGSFLEDRNQTLELDMIFVKQDAIKPHLVQKFIKICRERNLPIVLGIDYHLDLPSGDLAHNIDERKILVTKQLLKNAHGAIASLAAVSSQYQKLNQNITVLPPALPENYWLQPLPKSADFKLPIEIKRSPECFSLVFYADLTTLAEEIEFVQQLVESIQIEGHLIELIIINDGCRNIPENTPEPIKVIGIPAEIDSYADYVLWFRRIAACFDLAVIYRIPHQLDGKQKVLNTQTLLQYQATKIPCVLEKAIVDEEFIKDTEAWVVDSNTTWKQSIITLISNSKELEQITINAKENLEQKGLIAHCAHNICQLFLTAFEQYTVEKN